MSLETIWKMPVAIRRWWVDKLIEKYERQRQAVESQNGRNKQHTPNSFKKVHDQLKQFGDTGQDRGPASEPPSNLGPPGKMGPFGPGKK